MGQPVVHFEVVGKDGDALRSFYGDLFEWKINADNPMKYGIVDREENLGPTGIGIGGGVAGYEQVEGGVKFYVEVPDVDAAIARAEELGGKKVMAADQIMDGIEIGQFADPEGHVIGLIKSTA